jgi:dTDP-glucose 4,6-dehydratase
MESVLVTGGAGFIGSNIAESLIRQGLNVVVLDDLSTGKVENIAHLLNSDGLRFVRGSVLDGGLVRSVVESNDVSIISHQAARPSVEKSIKDPIRTTDTNITGTITLFKVAAECGCKRVVFASSSSVYGDAPELPKTESMPLNPKSPYAASKAAKEMFANIFTDIYGLEIVGLRYFNVYGRRQDPNSDYAAVIPRFISRAIKNEAITIEGDGRQTRDFTYIDDVVKANERALGREDISDRVFNIAYGERISIIELAKMIIEITGSSSEIEYRPSRAGDVRDSLSDIGMARTSLDYSPEYDIKKGLAETVRWYKNAYFMRQKASMGLQ